MLLLETSMDLNILGGYFSLSPCVGVLLNVTCMGL